MINGYEKGVQFEIDFANQINDKKIDELNPNLMRLVTYIFKNLDKHEKLKCTKLDNISKPDVCIYQKNKRYFISLKTGLTENLHHESIFSFIEFLKEQKFDEKIINDYLLFHYGDGTLDGSGTKRLSSVELRFKYNEEFLELNRAFNADKEFIKTFADRVIWQGVNKNADRAQVLYHGDVDFGFFVTRSQLSYHIDKRNWDYMDSCVHVGPFVIRPRARYLNTEVKVEEKRKTVSVHYPRLLLDIEYISSKYFK